MSAYSGLEELQYANHIDMVTGLCGSHAFRYKIIEIINKKESVGIMVLGIDNFKNINDLYSYSFGDMVLKYFASQIKNVLSSEVQLFRLDGDGFALLQKGTKDCDLEIAYKKIQTIAQTPREIQGLTISFSISAGICNYPDNAIDCEDLYKNARIALSKAKAGTKKNCVYYIPQLAEQVRIDMLLLENLKNSVQNNFEGFSLNYQPIMKSNQKTIDGCEALLRWNNPAFPNGISPYTFIPVLERSGLILAVGKFVIDKAFKQCALWNRIMPDFRMNVNVSARQFDEDDFISFVLDTIAKYDLNPNVITLELTESEPADYKSINNAFEYLRKHGIKTAFDDFGTGYASVDIFRSISADELKIDRSFIEQITYNVTDQIVLKSIIDMCRSMNIVVCVEGIENAEIEHIVSQMESLLLQGNLYSIPIPADGFENKYITVADKLIQSEDTEWLPPVRPMTSIEIVNNSLAGMIQTTMDRNFTLLACNEGFRRMIGYTAREIEEKFHNRGIELLHPDDVTWVPLDLVRQLGESDSATFEYRLSHRDAKYIWVLATGNLIKGSDGTQSLVITLIDIDTRKRAELAKNKLLETYEKILSNIPANVGGLGLPSTEISASLSNAQPITPLSSLLHKLQYLNSNTSIEPTFQYDFTTKIVRFSESLETMVGHKFQDNATFSFDFIYKDDRALLTNTIQNIQKGITPDVILLRVCKVDDSFIWCDVLIKPLTSKDNEITSIIAKITDIDKEYREKEFLKMSLQKDPLTGLLNKGTLYKKVTKSILDSPNKKYSLWILDIDDFKSINDNLGHYTGDKILDLVSQRIQYTFRKKDLVGRSGGDEYTIFMEYGDNKKLLIEKVKKLLTALREPFWIDKNIMLKISLSIGIACYPKDGKTFSELLSQADKSLYRAKKDGKDNFNIVQ